MIENILTNIATMYYPIGISSLSNYDNYIETFEFRSLIKRLNETFLETEETEIREKLLLEFRKNVELLSIDDFTLESSDKCLTFKIEIFEENFLYQICVNISVLVPYYLVYVLKNEVEMEPYKWISLPKRDQQLEKVRFSRHIALISEIIEKEINFTKFPIFLINKVIPDLSYADIDLNKFTFFNAFFLNDIEL